MHGITVNGLIGLLDRPGNNAGGFTGRERILSLTVNGQYLGYIQSAEIDGCGDGFVTDVNLSVVTEENPVENAEPVKHGKWIKGDSDTWNGFTRVRRHRCSLCGEAFNEWLKPRYYCPNCGAKMDAD